MTATVIRLVVDADPVRLQEAREAARAGYAKAVEILSAQPGVPQHPELGWYAEGLADWDEIAGSPLRPTGASR